MKPFNRQCHEDRLDFARNERTKDRRLLLCVPRLAGLAFVQKQETMQGKDDDDNTTQKSN